MRWTIEVRHDFAQLFVCGAVACTQWPCVPTALK